MGNAIACLSQAGIKDIETWLFSLILGDLVALGWKKTYEYDGLDAWTDYARVELEQRRQTLTFVWDTCEEGSISGSSELIGQLRRSYGLA